MKACEKNRKPITWLALGALDEKEAAALRAHLKDCAGCREFFEKSSVVTKNLASAGPDSDVQAPAHFHRQLMGRLRTEKPVSAWDGLLAALNWRVAVPAMMVLMLAVLVVFRPQPDGRVSTLRTAVPVAATATVTYPAPTVANYQIAASQSLSKLDELLTQEGNQSLPPAPIYRASMRLPENAF